MNDDTHQMTACCELINPLFNQKRMDCFKWY